MSDPFDVRSQELAREEAQERARYLAKLEEDDMKWLMSSKRGRRIVQRFISSPGVWKSSFSTNGLQMAFNEGRLAESKALMDKLMTWCFESYVIMHKESQGNG